MKLIEFAIVLALCLVGVFANVPLDEDNFSVNEHGFERLLKQFTPPERCSAVPKGGLRPVPIPRPKNLEKRELCQARLLKNTIYDANSSNRFVTGSWRRKLFGNNVFTRNGDDCLDGECGKMRFRFKENERNPNQKFFCMKVKIDAQNRNSFFINGYKKYTKVPADGKYHWACWKSVEGPNVDIYIRERGMRIRKIYYGAQNLECEGAKGIPHGFCLNFFNLPSLNELLEELPGPPPPGFLGGILDGIFYGNRKEQEATVAALVKQLRKLWRTEVPDEIKQQIKQLIKNPPPFLLAPPLPGPGFPGPEAGRT